MAREKEDSRIGLIDELLVSLSQKLMKRQKSIQMSRKTIISNPDAKCIEGFIFRAGATYFYKLCFYKHAHG